MTSILTDNNRASAINNSFDWSLNDDDGGCSAYWRKRTDRLITQTTHDMHCMTYVHDIHTVTYMTNMHYTAELCCTRISMRQTKFADRLAIGCRSLVTLDFVLKDCKSCDFHLSHFDLQ